MFMLVLDRRGLWTERPIRLAQSPLFHRAVIPDKRRSRADPGSIPELFWNGSRRSGRDDGAAVAKEVPA
ncbi:hypothetical protein [Bosea psychrotolerans]|uniref:hypothetical protein n=1 Tax=Bosea psychrotolerans TaxID=1871628 RepID=UPI0011B01D63|nr:hypothetical protein [Bosea psychrotolerans]